MVNTVTIDANFILGLLIVVLGFVVVLLQYIFLTKVKDIKDKFTGVKDEFTILWTRFDDLQTKLSSNCKETIRIDESVKKHQQVCKKLQGGEC